MTSVAVSAPGKVLLAGGYLVLDRAHTGLVFGLSARIHVIIQPIVAANEGVQFSEITVVSPQFLEASWRYGYHLDNQGGGIVVTQLQSGHGELVPNRFVEVTLTHVLTYISGVSKKIEQTLSHGICSSHITILADNDYYSHGPATDTTDTQTRRFQTFATNLSGAHKTGLGSSAALVTALTGALLTFYLPRLFDISTPEGMRVLHNLAQTAHCAAQGKVGSGFDIAAAVYGSCLYKRFHPEPLQILPEAGSPGFECHLMQTIERQWDVVIERPRDAMIPMGLTIRMADVDCGTSTVGMVKKLLDWKTNAPEASAKLWTQLQKANDILGSALRVQNPTESTIKRAIEDIRVLTRKMGAAAGVPIEPESQTSLLDGLSAVEGVIGGVVPGAGGYDAIALVMRKDDATKKSVEDFLQKWSHDTNTKVKLLGVKGEMGGAQMEDIKHEDYQGWY